MPEGTKEKGVVRWFGKRGVSYGFISLTRTGEDVFVHQKQIRMDGYRTLLEGQDVLFEVVEGSNGLVAQNVHPQRTFSPVPSRPDEICDRFHRPRDRSWGF